MLDQGSGVVADEISVANSMLGLWYDPDRLLIEGVYQDEITAYRARKRWMEALETNFLLEDAHDFSMRVRKSRGGHQYRVRCDFLTACGRYAFWRLTHHQAPEVQLMLETAHIPHTLPTRPKAVLFDEEDLAFEFGDGGAADSIQAKPTRDVPYLARAFREINKLAKRLSGITRSPR